MGNRGRRGAIWLVAGLALSGLWGCSETGTITEADAYKIGCPAIDSVAAGGSLTGKAVVAGLKQLRDEQALGPEARQWADAAIEALESEKPKELSSGARATLTQGCAEKGYPLRNLG